MSDRDSVGSQEDESLSAHNIDNKTNDEDIKAQTPEQWKTIGNTHFAKFHYSKALECYTNAIQLATQGNTSEGEVDQSKLAVYYANRAFCHIRMEEYGDAIEDATKAIQADPKYAKGYYRRGAACLSLSKFRDALQDFRQVSKQYPKSKEAKVKLEECKKAIRELEFREAIESSNSKPVSETLNLDAITVLDTHDGPKFEESSISLEFVQAMVQRFKDQKSIHIKYACKILLQIIALLSKTPTIMEIDIPQGNHFTVCGDVHGQYFDMLNIFSLNGEPSPENPYLFNGDFVDRGSFSCEVIFTLFAYKLLYPTGMYLTRGNHESLTMNQMYGFHGEVLAKYDKTVFDLFQEAFNWLPLGALLGHQILVVHGGLFSRDDVTLDELKKIDRNRQPPDSGLMSEILWSDPCRTYGRQPSKRGVGSAFGPDITEDFLRRNNLELIVRSHEVKDEGYEIEPKCRLVTVFSAPNYCDQMGNKGAYIKFNSFYQPQYFQFTAVPHPDVKPMAYSRNSLFF